MLPYSERREWKTGETKFDFQWKGVESSVGPQCTYSFLKAKNVRLRVRSLRNVTGI